MLVRKLMAINNFRVNFTLKVLIFLIALFLFQFTAAIQPQPAYAIRAQAERLCDEGKKLLELNKNAEADSKFKAAIAEDGSYAPSYYYVAQMLYLQGNNDEALIYIKKALANSPHEELYKSLQCDINAAVALKSAKNGNMDRAYKLYYENLEILNYHIPTYNRLASLFISKGDYSNAILQCNKALESAASMPPTIKYDPSELAFLHANMALCFFESKNYYRAMNEIEAAKKIKATDYVEKYYKKIMSDENPVFSDFKKGEQAFNSGDLKQARVYFEKVKQINPNYQPVNEKLNAIYNQEKIDTLLAEAQNLETKGSFNEAAERYNEALTLNPAKKEYAAKVTELEERAKKEQQTALSSMKKNPKKSGGTAESTLIDENLKKLAAREQSDKDPNQKYEQKFRAAEALYEKREYEKALALYREIFEDKEDFKHDEILKRMKTIYTNLDEFYIEYIDLALPKLYIYIIIVVTLGLILWCYFGGQIMLMMKPDPHKDYKNGIEYLEQENYPKAIQCFEKAILNAVDPIERTKVKSKLSTCYFKIKDYDKCIKTSLEVLDVDPKNEIVHGYLANSFLEKNMQTERAITEYKLLYKKQKDDKKLLGLLCDFFVKNDDLSQDAIDIYQRIYAADPSNKRVRNLLLEFFIRANDKGDLAMKVYESVCADDKNNVEVKMMLITAVFHRKNYQECVKLCRELFEKGVFDDITIDYYTNSFTKLQKRFELLDEYQNYVKKFPDNQALKRYWDRMFPVFNAERLMSGGQPAAVSSQVKAQPEAPKSDFIPAAAERKTGAAPLSDQESEVNSAGQNNLSTGFNFSDAAAKAAEPERQNLTPPENVKINETNINADNMKVEIANERPAAEQRPTPPGAQVINICKKCAHMNPPGATSCRKCSAPL